MEIIALIMTGAFALVSIGFIVTLIKLNKANSKLDELDEKKIKNELNSLRSENKKLSSSVSDSKKFNRELQQKLKKLEGLNHQLQDEKVQLSKQIEKNSDLQSKKDELFATFIHDIKNPAGLIKNIASLLDSYDGNMEEQRDMIQKLFSTSDRIIQFSTEISKFLASDERPYELYIEKTPVSTILNLTYKNLKYKADEKEQELVVQMQKNMPEVELDLEMIHEALQNLVDNAIKYSGRGKRIEIRARKMDQQAHFEVIDQGPGMSREDIDKAFEKGVRLTAKPTAGESSTGLGLWIVKKIAKEHNGNVYIKSELGKGSTFGFVLPITQPEKESE